MRLSDTFRIQGLDEDTGPDVLVCSRLAEKRVPHGFTLRWRRIDRDEPKEPFGLRHRDSADRADLARSLGLIGHQHMTQIHENDVRLITEPSVDVPVCDGMLTGQKGLGLSVQTADCVPLLMWNQVKNVVAAVHAGWRGTLAGIASRAVRTMNEETETVAHTIHVVMGPAIGRCCYEVGDEVWSAFVGRNPASEELFSPGRKGRKHLDLIEANRRQLQAEGVPPNQIFSSDLCTVCNNDVLYSYRKEGKAAGRQYGMIGPK
jgi:YfiH family protein